MTDWAQPVTSDDADRLGLKGFAKARLWFESSSEALRFAAGDGIFFFDHSRQRWAASGTVSAAGRDLLNVAIEAIIEINVARKSPLRDALPLDLRPWIMQPKGLARPLSPPDIGDSLFLELARAASEPATNNFGLV